MIGVTACGNSNKQTESGQGITGHRGDEHFMETNQTTEEGNSGLNSVADPASVNMDGSNVSGNV